MCIAPTPESHANCRRCLAKLAARNKHIFFGLSMNSGWEKDARRVGFSLAAAITTDVVDFLLLCLDSVQTSVVAVLPPI